jgi:hypothetical protein
VDNLEGLPPNVAALVTQIRMKFGTPPSDWRYPTYTEMMEAEREMNSRREIFAWFSKLKADDWKINGIPLSSLD